MIPVTIRQLQEMNPKELFLFSTRWCFGFWLLFLGLNKWIGGANSFVSFIESSFADTFLPGTLVNITAWIIIIMEPLCALWLILGFKQRLAWIATGKLMFILMIGKTITHDYQTVANNWQYLVLCLACAALSERKQ